MGGIAQAGIGAALGRHTQADSGWRRLEKIDADQRAVVEHLEILTVVIIVDLAAFARVDHRRNHTARGVPGLHGKVFLIKKVARRDGPFEQSLAGIEPDPELIGLFNREKLLIGLEQVRVVARGRKGVGGHGGTRTQDQQQPVQSKTTVSRHGLVCGWGRPGFDQAAGAWFQDRLLCRILGPAAAEAAGPILITANSHNGQRP